MSVDYGHMTADELVDHFIDDDGLAPFIDTRQRGIPMLRPQACPACGGATTHGKKVCTTNDCGMVLEWDWREIALDLQALSRGYLTFSPEYLADLYEMQAQRHVARALEEAV